MIRYHKTDALKVMRSDTPEPPFSAETTLAPYSFPRSEPVALDYVRLVGTSINRADVTVSRSEPDLVDPHGPVMIDSTESAELVYRRGERCHRWLLEHTNEPVVQLISSLGAVPDVPPSGRSTVVLCAWPLLFTDLSRLARKLSQKKMRWGLAIPILFPATTDLERLARLSAIATEHRAEFLAGVQFDLDPNARRALAALFPVDDETYSTLFDQGAERIATATERHIAALAREHGMKDVITPDEERSNWNAARLTAQAGSRLIAMREDVELGWEFLRAARQIATLDKPLTRIAAAANLSIIEGLPPQVVDALEDWLSARPPEFFEEIDTRFRLRRDYGVMSDE